MDNLKKELGQLKKVFDDKKKQATSPNAPPTQKPQPQKVTPKKPPFTKPEDEEETEDQPSGTAPPEKAKTNPFPAKKEKGGDDDEKADLRTKPADNRRRFGN